ncbi:MAG: MG2 domain-containing protein [Bacteroides sp.]|nr:MG2 domain-containing protein [Bacteroides sp.]
MKTYGFSSLSIRNCIRAASSALAIMSLLSSCHGNTADKESIRHDTSVGVTATGQSVYIKAYTGGTVNDGTPVRVEFTAPVHGAETGAEADRKLFSFSPSLKGSARWASSDALEFIPEKYSQGTTYKATLRLDRIQGLESSGKFSFSFHAAAKEAYFSTGHVRIPASAPESATVSGKIEFSEEMSEKDVAGMLSCRYDGKDIPLSLKKDGNSFIFMAERLERGSRDKVASINFNGKAYGFREKENFRVTVPASGQFKVSDAVQVTGNDPYIEVTFSEPLGQGIDPDGLFRVHNAGKHYTKIEDNAAYIYYEKDGSGSNISIEIAAGVQDISQTRLGSTFRKEFSQGALKPAVEIPLKGNILPDAENMVMPFRSVNLSAVDISIIKIYESNVLMFLQSNGINGSEELRRAGRLVYKKRIDLDTDPGIDLHKWQDFSVDLSGLIRQDPGAIYRVRLSFRKEYSLYGVLKSNSVRSSMVNVASGEMTEQENAVWDEPYPYYYENTYDWNLYRWRDRDDPSTPSYYMVNDRFPERNIMSSDIGIVVKQSDGEHIWVAVNNILTAEPVQGATVSAYSYQLQKTGEARTDKDGFADIVTKGSKAFAITAKSGNSVSYLKVTDGNEKSLSRFDTGGQKIADGIKGFVYGERGVWRPGDTLHVTIMVEDREKRLPDKHPVTMEVFTPQGQFYDKQVSANGTGGMYSFDIVTSEDDPTGTWNAYFKVGGATFHKPFNIEAIKPNRLKLSLDIKEKMLDAGKSVNGILNASWLTGPAAAGLEAEVEMTLRNGKTAFNGYEGYVFSNTAAEFSSTTSTVMSGKLDNNGKLAAGMKMPYAKGAPGMLSATLVTRVTEPGGDQSFTTSTMPFSPYSAYVGLKFPESEDGYVETDRQHEIQAVVLDKEGKKVAGHRLEYRIYRLKWSWWWESRSESLDSYVNGTAADAIAKGSLTSTEGISRIPFRIDYPEWGRYFIYIKDITSGHSSGGTIYVDWPSWRGRADRTDPDGLTMLTFSLDRKSYMTGDEATVFIPAAKGGKALVSLENGSGVISRTWVATGSSETPYKFRIEKGMAPNFYVHITLLQPHGNVENDLPIRLYGVQPVMVNDPKTHLNPEIIMPDVLRPQEEFTVKVKEKDGRPMSYTIAIVDEGLLDITAFKTPDPWNAMYAREALGVRTWDLYDEVIGAYSGRFSPLFSIGGDENVLKSNKRDNRFNPVVKFIGPFTLPAKGTGTHKVTLPMYIGSVKAMVVACSDGAYGNASKAVPVRSPLMILSSLPRVLGTGEKVSLPVNVFAMEDNVKDVTVKVSVSGAARLEGTASRTIKFSRTGDKLTDFSIITAEKGGTAEIKITAEGGDHSASETINVTVRNPEPAVTSVFRESIASGETSEISYGAFPADDKEAWAKLELASFPSMDFSGCFTFVSDYSHYCSEQLSSKGLTMLYLSGLVDEMEQAVAKDAIPQIIKLLSSRQLPDGGFVYWPGQANADEWVTSMAGQFLTEAASKGYEVNAGVLASWKNFQKRCVRNYRESNLYDLNDLVQAYRLYTLALASDPDTGAMNRMKSSSSLSGQATWRLAAAYAIAGKKSIAREMVSGIRTTVEEYRSSNRTYGSSLRDRAMYLETLVLTGDMAAAIGLAGELASEFQGTAWYTTQNVAFMSVAMSRLAEKANTGALDVTIGNEKVRSAKSVYTCSLDPSDRKAIIGNNSSGAIYATVTTRRQMPSGTVSAEASGLGISVKYTGSDGNSLNAGQLIQGTDIYADITVSNTGGVQDYTGLALTVTAPSGWDIFNSRLLGLEETGQEYTYMDVRDDKVIYYFDLGKGMRKTFKVRFNAAYCGDFVIPSVRCEAMYDPAVFARTASGRTTVR